MIIKLNCYYSFKFCGKITGCSDTFLATTQSRNCSYVSFPLDDVLLNTASECINLLWMFKRACITMGCSVNASQLIEFLHTRVFELTLGNTNHLSKTIQFVCLIISLPAQLFIINILLSSATVS